MVIFAEKIFSFPSNLDTNNLYSNIRICPYDRKMIWLRYLEKAKLFAFSRAKFDLMIANTKLHAHHSSKFQVTGNKNIYYFALYKK